MLKKYSIILNKELHFSFQLKYNIQILSELLLMKYTNKAELILKNKWNLTYILSNNIQLYLKIDFPVNN